MVVHVDLGIPAQVVFPCVLTSSRQAQVILLLRPDARFQILVDCVVRQAVHLAPELIVGSLQDFLLQCVLRRKPYHRFPRHDPGQVVAQRNGFPVIVALKQRELGVVRFSKFDGFRRLGLGNALCRFQNRLIPRCRLGLCGRKNIGYPPRRRGGHGEQADTDGRGQNIKDGFLPGKVLLFHIGCLLCGGVHHVQIPVIHVLQRSEKVLSVHTLIPSLSSCLRSFCRRQLKRYFTFRSVRPSLSAISLIAML